MLDVLGQRGAKFLERSGELLIRWSVDCMR
jgi:hypothetical protein